MIWRKKTEAKNQPIIRETIVRDPDDKPLNAIRINPCDDMKWRVQIKCEETLGFYAINRFWKNHDAIFGNIFGNTQGFTSSEEAMIAHRKWKEFISQPVIYLEEV